MKILIYLGHPAHLHKRSDNLRVNRRIDLRVGADEYAILLDHKNSINKIYGEKRINKVKGFKHGSS
jgi:hypothetical protein